MFLIGLTGGIACGKSEVSKRLAEQGLSIVDVDVIGRELVVPGSSLLTKIVDNFGDGILQKDGTLDRARLGRIVFADQDMLDQLNAIMHPAIWREGWLRIAALRADHKVAVLVAPLLFEHGGESMVDTVWVVGCSKETQLRRLCERDHLTIEQAHQRLAAQMPLEKKLDLADHVINNDGSLEDLDREVAICMEMLHNRLAKVDVDDKESGQ